MTKELRLRREDNTETHVASLRESALATKDKIAAAMAEPDPLQFLSELKFAQIGHDPLNPARRLNLIEQLNQTFTYLAAFKSVEFLFSRHAAATYFQLNLGNRKGWDVETDEEEGVVAEVFAAVTPANNAKLSEDIKKVLAAPHRNKYVLFISPRHPPGPLEHRLANGQVKVWSLGGAL